MNKHLFSLLVVISLFSQRTHAQLYLGVVGDFGNKVHIHENDRIQNPISGSLGVNIFLDTKIKNNFYMKYGLSSGFVNAKVVIPEFGAFESIYIADLFHISGNLAFGKRFTLGEHGFIDFFAGGGVSFFGGEDYGGKIGPTTTSDIVFQYETYRTDSRPRGFGELLVQTKVNRVMLVGLRYQQHFKEVLGGTYILYGGNQPTMAGILSMLPACVSLQVAFKVASVGRG